MFHFIRHFKIHQVLVFFLLTCVYILFNKFHFLAGPDREFVFKVMSTYDPTFFLKDVLATLSNQAYYTFLVWPLAFLHHWFDLHAIFFIGHVLTTFFYLFGVYRLSKTIFNDSMAAFLAVMGVFVIKPVLIDASLYPTCFYHRNVALVLQIFGIDFFLRKKLSLAFLFLGLSFDMTPYSGIHAILICFFALFFFLRQYALLELLRAFVVLVMITAPMFIWRLTYGGDIPLFRAPEGWIEYLRTYAPAYAFPTSLWKPENGGMNTLAMAFIWPVYFLAPFMKGYLRFEGFHKVVGLMSVGLLVLFGIGFVFAELIPVSAVIQFMLFRAHRIFVLFAVIYFSFYLLLRFQEEKSFISVIFISILMAAFFSSKMILSTVLIISDLSILFLFKNDLRRHVIFGGICVSLVLIYFFSEIWNAPFFERLFHLDIAFVFLCIITFTFLKILPANFLQLVYAVLFSFILLPGYWNMKSMFQTDPFGTIYRQIEWPWKPLNHEYTSLFKWVRTATEKEALFLIPAVDFRLNRYFRAFAERGEILAGNESTGIISYRYGQKWKELNKKFSALDELSDLENILNMDTDQIRNLNRDYPFDYYLTLLKAKPLDFPIAFQNEQFIVYQLNGIRSNVTV